MLPSLPPNTTNLSMTNVPLWYPLGCGLWPFVSTDIHVMASRLRACKSFKAFESSPPPKIYNVSCHMKLLCARRGQGRGPKVSGLLHIMVTNTCISCWYYRWWEIIQKAYLCPAHKGHLCNANHLHLQKCRFSHDVPQYYEHALLVVSRLTFLA